MSQIIQQLILQLALILLNAFFAATEIAVISLNEKKVKARAEDGDKKAVRMLKMIEEPTRFLSTIQIGITVIGILTGIYSGNVLADDFAAILVNWGVSENFAHSLGQAIIVVFVTYLTLIFGELVPKRIGMSVAEKAAKVVSKPMYFLSVIASPFVWILAKSTSGIMNYVAQSKNTDFIIGTENSIVTHLQLQCPDKMFYQLSKDLICRDMKATTLVDVLNCCKGTFGQVIELDEETYKGAKKCIDEMIRLG